MAGHPTDGASTHGGRYRRIRRLGAGGMASVFLAEDEVLDRDVAIKRIHSTSPEDTLKRFRREAKLGASVNHPNLVSVYDSITEEDGLLIVMEFVDGESLSERLRKGALDPGDALEILDQVAAAVDHLHENSVVHRDIKPSNILIRRDGLAKLADLGIATATDMTAITATSGVIGSLPYMAPERLHGMATGSSSDIFSLGAVAFEMLAGQRVHDAATPEEQIRLASSDAAPDLLDAWPEAPDAAARVIARALAYEPGSRPLSAIAFASDLRHALDTETGTATATRQVPTAPMRVVPPPPPPPPELSAPVSPPPPPRPKVGWRGVAIAALMVAIVAIAGIALANSGGDDEAPNDVVSTPQKAGTDADATKDSTTQQAAATTPEPAPDPEPTSDPVALNDKGKALIDAGDPVSAIPFLEQAVDAYETGTEDQTYYFALFNLGNALRLAGRPQEAIPYLEERLNYDDQIPVVEAELELAREEAGVDTTSSDEVGGVGPVPEEGSGDEKPDKEKPDKGPKPGKGLGGGVGPG